MNEIQEGTKYIIGVVLAIIGFREMFLIIFDNTIYKKAERDDVICKK